MKTIRNEALQRLELYLDTDRGSKRVWLMPKETIVVPASYLSGQIKNLTERRILKVRNA
jgi:hypothetical protein